MRWLFACLFVFFASISHAESANDARLHSKDVRKIMTQILAYHITENQITSNIVKRALKAYVESFDPAKTYLLAAEVEPYLHPSDALVEQFLADYNNDSIESFSQLHKLLVSSVFRSEKWREDFVLQKNELFDEARKPQDLFETQSLDYKNFASDATSLQLRLRTQLTSFLRNQEQRQEKTLTPEEEQKAIALFDKRKKDHEKAYLLTDENKEHVVVIDTLKAFAKSLDSHTAYFTPAEAYDMRARLEKGVFGIGIVLQEGLDGVEITDLIEGGPAKQSGLVQPKDRIVAIDGIDITQMTFHEALDMIRGEEGSSIELRLARGTTNSDVTLTRKKIHIDNDRVESSFIPIQDGIIGRITLHSFYEGDDGISSEKDIRRALLDLNSKGELKGLVFDLRDNSGGFLMQAVKVAGLFMSNGVVVVSRYSDGFSRYFRDIDGYALYDGPLVVLTSKTSASAAEIVAQALQDYGNAVIVGDDRTYGKGTIQHQTVTNEGSSKEDPNASFFKVTVGMYFTASGRSAQLAGVRSDILVPGVSFHEEIGEEFSEYPLQNRSIAPSFDDSLSDIGTQAKEWFRKYYIPTIQKQSDTWRLLLPTLRNNSVRRLGADSFYQSFLHQAIPPGSMNYKTLEKRLQDTQMDEATNIVKDMIELAPPSKASSVQSASLSRK